LSVQHRSCFLLDSNTIIIFLGKPTRALDTLYDVIKSKKRNHNYSEKLIEEIMYKYLELCVDLKKSHVAKEGLFQYRNMCQSVNVASLASVVQVNRTKYLVWSILISVQ
jgi:hypothetical protein